MARPFKKGDSRINRKGRPKTSREAKLVQSLTLDEYRRIVGKYLALSIEELNRLKNDSSITSLEACVVAVILNAIKKGDTTRIDSLLNRMIGKTPDPIRHSGSVELNHKMIATILDEYDEEDHHVC